MTGKIRRAIAERQKSSYKMKNRLNEDWCCVEWVEEGRDEEGDSAVTGVYDEGRDSRKIAEINKQRYVGRKEVMEKTG